MTVGKAYGRDGSMFAPGGMIVREREPLNLEMPFGSLDGFITPVDRVFVRSHFSIPQIDVKTWRLKIEGEVETPLELTYDEVRAMASRTVAVTMECAGISKLRALTGGRKVATGLVTSALILIIIILMGVAFFGPMKNSVMKLSEQLPHYWDRLQKPLIKIEKQAVIAEEKLQAEVAVEIAHSSTNAPKTEPVKKGAPPPPETAHKEPVSLRTSLNHVFQTMFSSFSGVAFNAAQILVVLITVFFGVTFTLMDPRPIFGAIFLVVPARHHEQTVIIMQRIGKFVPTWAFATLLAMFTVGLLVFLLMWTFFGFMEALVLGLIAGVFEAIPYLGPILSAVPALLFALGQGGATPAWVLLIYLGIQLVENKSSLRSSWRAV